MLVPLAHAYADDWENNHKVVFDGINRLIIVPTSATSIDIKSDIYSAWKEWMLLRDHGKFLAAIRTTGGDPTVQGQRSGDIYFLVNGWRLVIDFNFTGVSGILFSDDFDTAYYDDVLNPLYPAQVSSTVNAVETLQTILSEETVTQQYDALSSAVAALQTLSPAEAERLLDIWQRLGLDKANPATNNTDGSYSFGNVTVDATEDPSGNITHRRQ